MASAKRELRDAIDQLQEPEAELLLSLLHYLRARGHPHQSGTEEGSRSEQDPWLRLVPFLLALEGTSHQESMDELLETLRASRASPPSVLSEDVLARDWDRPEEDEAWADL